MRILFQGDSITDVAAIRHSHNHEDRKVRNCDKLLLLSPSKLHPYQCDYRKYQLLLAYLNNQNNIMDLWNTI